MGHSNELGEFLQARRSVLTPAEAGLFPGQDRRVSGLRREEVAMLAGVSTDYYRRLEQGRERRPSRQVLEAIAQALQLDAHAVRHLHEIAAPASAVATEQSPTTISPGLRVLLDHSLTRPASVIGPALDVLATNSLARALYSPFTRMDNIARMVFLDPAARDFYVDWEKVARSAVANLRAGSTMFPAETRVSQVVGELCIASPTFARLWAEHEVRPRVEGDKLFRHPQVGELRLYFEAMWVSGAPGQRVYVYSPAPGSPSEDALHLLGRLAAGVDDPSGDYPSGDGPSAGRQDRDVDCDAPPSGDA
jgi:transcriptional regulator with XRE-family HTH domain